jgi:hypothetical protein
MRKRLTQFAGWVVLTGALVGGAQSVIAQDEFSKDVRRAMKQEKRAQRDQAKLERWAERFEKKQASHLAEEQRFDTAYTARGSEITFITSQGQKVSLGYIDKRNNVKLYRQ